MSAMSHHASPQGHLIVGAANVVQFLLRKGNQHGTAAKRREIPNRSATADVCSPQTKATLMLRSRPESIHGKRAKSIQIAARL
jgi:hypothetical protein